MRVADLDAFLYDVVKVSDQCLLTVRSLRLRREVIHAFHHIAGQAVRFKDEAVENKDGQRARKDEWPSGLPNVEGNGCLLFLFLITSL